MGKQIKSLFLLTLLEQVCSYFGFHLTVIQLFISKWEKTMEIYVILLYMFLMLPETF